ncbi:small ribosomal subunit protein uS17m [Phymastichus coffea]|uniref:small ribosomal subunit protein uS17m n=1 Tax=Phymastichus coffea TaxID=108790 RepID=UPI00273C0811|nr:small ribosomal subunit protein uS17m [Phymastichus coffea]
MAVSNSVKQSLKYLMGKCVPSLKTNAAKIGIPRYEYDENLHMYFKKHDFVYAHDPQKICKTGDMVLIQSLPEKMTRLIQHKVIEVIFPLGDITDPITGKKVVAGQYREKIKEVNEMFGKSEKGFDYDKAPSRGSLEDTRDFTHRPMFQKYHDDPNDPQPYHV